MQRITIPVVGLVVLAGLADVVGAHELAFYALVAAVPAAAAAALVALDRALTGSEEHRLLPRAWLHATVLVLVLLSAAVRAPVRDEGVVPQLATSALVTCLVVFALQLLLSGLPQVRLRRRSSSRSRPRARAAA